MVVHMILLSDYFDSMVDVIISIVTKVAEYLVEPLIREGKYLFCVNNFIGEIDNEKNELISERDSLID